jgi:hypothetical protein
VSDGQRAEPLDLRRGILRCIGVQVGHYDAGAMASEALHDAPADPLASTRHDRNHPVEARW